MCVCVCVCVCVCGIVFVCLWNHICARTHPQPPTRTRTRTRTRTHTHPYPQVVPVRIKCTKKLVSADNHSNLFNFKYAHLCVIAPLCKDDLLALPNSLAKRYVVQAWGVWL